MTVACPPLAPRPGEPDRQYDDPSLYINREVSWLQFNWRVLEEAIDGRHPLLERVKFLAIFANNLDEFFMIRVSGLLRQIAGGVLEAPPDGMTPSEQLTAIHQTLTVQLEQLAACWRDDILPQLRDADIHIHAYSDLQPAQRALLRQYFEREIFPALTPLAFDPAHPFPHISNLSFNLAVVVNEPRRSECFARIKIEDTFARLIRIPTGHARRVARTQRRMSTMILSGSKRWWPPTWTYCFQGWTSSPPTPSGSPVTPISKLRTTKRRIS